LSENLYYDINSSIHHLSHHIHCYLQLHTQYIFMFIYNRFFTARHIVSGERSFWPVLKIPVTHHITFTLFLYLKNDRSSFSLTCQMLTYKLKSSCMFLKYVRLSDHHSSFFSATLSMLDYFSVFHFKVITFPLIEDMYMCSSLWIFSFRSNEQH
jgi:hypothetical protein